MKRAQLVGSVVAIDKRGMVVRAAESGREFKARCDAFCSLQKGDAISGVVLYQSNPSTEVLLFERAPIATMGTDRDTILSCILKALHGTGVGPARADQLIDELTEGGSEKVDQYLIRLSELFNNLPRGGVEEILSEHLRPIQGIKLLRWWHKNRTLRRLYLLGFTKTEIRACYIHMTYDQIFKKCMSDPFTIVELSYERAREMYARMGREPTPEQDKAGVIARKVYHNMNNNGWTGTPTNIVMRDFPDIGEVLPLLFDAYEMKGELHTLYLPFPYKVEVFISDYIKEKLKVEPSLDGDVLFKRGNLTDEQKVAVEGALRDPVSIITGCAGSGKTTIIDELIFNLEQRNITYSVTSFTGKAVARLREVTGGRKAGTMHSHIYSNTMEHDFEHLIIDETSMVTTELLYQYLKKFHETEYKITFVGDKNQLPPIGWGSLFEQLLASKKVPIYRLTTNKRADVVGQCGIRINADLIVEAMETDDDDVIRRFQIVETTNFRIMDGDEDTVVKIVELLAGSGIPSTSVTVICPYNAPLDALNARIQRIHNGDRGYIADGCKKDRLFYLGDRVTMTENNYGINIMNGEEGMVTDFDIQMRELTVLFRDGASHHFKLDPLPPDDEKNVSTETLRHSFAMTIHLSQGSEWEYVIFYMPPTAKVSSFLNSRLIYTAVTRARKALWYVGDSSSLNTAAIKNPPYRCDNLCQRLLT